jgi:hypothetical protein
MCFIFREEKDMKKIEEIRKNLVEAGFYRKEDIEKICEIEKAYLEECRDIAEQCEAEGYPAHGSNYDLRCAEARKCYNEQLEAIDGKYEEEE